MATFREEQVRTGWSRTRWLVVIGVLAVLYVTKERAPRWLAPTLGGLVVLNVGLAVFWT